MDRWIGWGEQSHVTAVPPGLAALLRRELGPGQPRPDARLEDVLATVPAGRLPPAAGWSTDPLDRLLHARGQGLPDLVALRSGAVGAVPDAVAHPGSGEEVRRLLAAAARTGAAVIPYGGGTSVVGGVTPPDGDRPVLTVDLRGLHQLVELDDHALLATFGAGVTGPQLEAALDPYGLTLGHVPQSFERSTLGGWVATRSSGQQSLGSGRIEDLFAGGRLESPRGPLELAPFPASAAGPDLRQLVLGSEGRLGVLTQVTVRVRRRLAVQQVVAAFLPDWAAGLAVLRALAQDSADLSLLRLSTPAETATSLLLGGPAGSALAGALALRGLGTGRCLLLAGVTGSTDRARRARRRVGAVVRTQGGVRTGTPLGRRWQAGRFQGPHLRDALWACGYGVDTVETATTWSRVPGLVQRLEAALHGALEEPVHVGSHLSHVYPSGSSVYTTVVFRLGADAGTTLDRWGRLKAASLAAVRDGGGTVSHQHGVGLDHRDALVEEKGPLGTAALDALVRTFDPDGRMNPGKLLP